MESTSKSSGSALLGSKRGVLTIGGAGIGIASAVLPNIVNSIESIPMPAIMGVLVLVGLTIVFYSIQDCIQTVWDRKIELKRLENELTIEMERNKGNL